MRLLSEVVAGRFRQFNPLISCRPVSSPGRLVKRSFFETPRRPSFTLRDNYLVDDSGNEFPVLLEFCG